MNYELAKQLEKAGFPQERGHEYFYSDGMGINPYWICVGQQMIPKGAKRLERCPTLNELIEACVNHKDAYCFELIGPNIESLDWLARINPQDSSGGIGKTSEEAVANLWLELEKE